MSFVTLSVKKKENKEQTGKKEEEGELRGRKLDSEEEGCIQKKK